MTNIVFIEELSPGIWAAERHVKDPKFIGGNWEYVEFNFNYLLDGDTEFYESLLQASPIV